MYKRQVLEKAPKFNPYLQVKDFEVCIISSKDASQIECTLVISHEKRTLSRERIDESDTVYIKRESLLYLLSEIETFCEHQPDDCREAGEDYKSIKRIFIF